MDLSVFSGMGYGTAVAVVAVVAAVALFRHWKKQDKLEEELRNVSEKYNKALDDMDAELAASYFRRMQKLRKQLGKT